MIRGLPHKMAHLTVLRTGLGTYNAARPVLSNQTCQSPEQPHPLWSGVRQQGLRKVGYGGVEFELRTSCGLPVPLGASVKAHIRDEYTTLTGATPPHKPSSTGRVRTEAGEYFPEVYGLEWVAL